MSVLAMSSAAWALYDKATRIQVIGSWISYLLPYQNPKVRELLESLKRRVDVIAQPLNYCLIWAQDKGTCVSDIVFQARDLLYRVENFVHDCAMRQKRNEKIFSDELLGVLKGYLKELDFCINSVNLAVTLINSSILSRGDNRSMSPSALLHASTRISEMHNAGGDLALLFGALYRCRLPVASANDDGRPPPSGDEAWEQVDFRPADIPSSVPIGQWEKLLSQAALRLYRNSKHMRYELHVGLASPGGRDGKDGNFETRVLELTMQLGFQICTTMEMSLYTRDRGGDMPVAVDVADVGFTWVENFGSDGCSRFAFILSNIAAQANAAGSLKPVEVVYTARLCMYENMARAQRNTSKHASQLEPAHITARDEELWHLLSEQSTKFSAAPVVSTMYHSFENDPILSTSWMAQPASGTNMQPECKVASPVAGLQDAMASPGRGGIRDSLSGVDALPSVFDDPASGPQSVYPPIDILAEAFSNTNAHSDAESDGGLNEQLEHMEFAPAKAMRVEVVSPQRQIRAAVMSPPRLPSRQSSGTLPSTSSDEKQKQDD